MENLIVTPEALHTAGQVSYWRLSDTVNLRRLTAAWDQANLPADLLPKPVSKDTALGRAVHEQAAKRRLVRPLARRGAWAIVDEAVAEAGVDYEHLLTVRFSKGLPEFTRVDATHTKYDELTAEIRASYDRQQGELAPEDVSAWLVKLAERNQAVSLRDTGGIYFVPRPAVSFWNSVVQALESVSSHRVFRIPAMRNSEAIDAITDAITAEAEKAVATVESELALTGEDALGDRALATRATECQALLKKVAAYDDLLGTQMKVRSRVEELQASIVAASMLIGAQEEQAA